MAPKMISKKTVAKKTVAKATAEASVPAADIAETSKAVEVEEVAEVAEVAEIEEVEEVEEVAEIEEEVAEVDETDIAEAPEVPDKIAGNIEELTSLLHQAGLVATRLKKLVKGDKRKKSGTKRAPSAYNIFLGKTIKELKVTEPDMISTDRFRKAVSMWKEHRAEIDASA